MIVPAGAAPPAGASFIGMFAGYCVPCGGDGDNDGDEDEVAEFMNVIKACPNHLKESGDMWDIGEAIERLVNAKYEQDEVYETTMGDSLTTWIC